MLDFDLPRRLPADLFADIFSSAGKRTVTALLPQLLAAGDPFSPDIRSRFLAEIDRSYAGELNRLLSFWYDKHPEIDQDKVLELAAALTAVPDPVCTALIYCALLRAEPEKAERFRSEVLGMLEEEADGFARMALDDSLRAPVPISGRVPVKAYPAMVLCKALRPEGVDLNLLAEGIAAMLGRKWIPACDEALEKFAAAVEKEGLSVLPLSDLVGFGTFAEALRKCLTAGKPIPESAFSVFERLSARQSRDDAGITASCLWILRRAETAERIKALLKQRDFRGVNAAAEAVPPCPGVSFPDRPTGKHRLAPDFEAAAASGTAAALGTGNAALLTPKAVDLLVKLGLSSETAELWRMKMPDLIRTVCREEGAGRDMSRIASLFSEDTWQRAVCALEARSEETPWRFLPARYAYAFRSVIADFDALTFELTDSAGELERALQGVKGLPVAGRYFFAEALTGKNRDEALRLIGTDAWRDAGGGDLHVKFETLRCGSGTRTKVSESLWEDLMEAFEKTMDRARLGRLSSVLVPMYPNIHKEWERRRVCTQLRKAVLAGSVNAGILRTGMTTAVFSNFIESNFNPSEIEKLKAAAMPDAEYGRVVRDLISRRLKTADEIAADIFERKRDGVPPCRKYRRWHKRDQVFDLAVRILQSRTPVIRASKPINDKEKLVRQPAAGKAAELALPFASRLSGALSILELLEGRCASELEALVSGDKKRSLKHHRLGGLRKSLLEKLPGLGDLMMHQDGLPEGNSLSEKAAGELRKAGIENLAAAELVTEICSRFADEGNGRTK